MDFRELLSKDNGASFLAVVRILFGIMFLWAFLDKMFGLGMETPLNQGLIQGYSPSAYLMYMSDNTFYPLFSIFAGNIVTDAVLMVGLLLMGTALILGIASKITTVATISFLFLMMLVVFPPTDNIVDYHLIYIVMMFAVYLGHGFSRIGFEGRWLESKLVKRFGLLG